MTINIPISCGGVAVYPGDIIVGDADGVVVVPQNHAQEILTKAKEKIAKDQIREDTISGKPEEIKKYIESNGEIEKLLSIFGPEGKASD